MNSTVINIGVNKVSLKKFVVTPEGARLSDSEALALNIDIQISFLRKSNKAFICSLTTNIGKKDAQAVVGIASIAMETDFYVENLEELSHTKEDGKLFFKRNLVDVVFDITYNQIRGAWVALVNGGTLEWLTLPLITGEVILGDATEFPARPIPAEK